MVFSFDLSGTARLGGGRPVAGKGRAGLERFFVLLFEFFYSFLQLPHLFFYLFQNFLARPNDGVTG